MRNKRVKTQVVAAHHIRTKEELGVAIIDSYLEQFSRILNPLANEDIFAKKTLPRSGYFFTIRISDWLIPSCGVLAVDSVELLASMQKRVKNFIQIQLNWLKSLIAIGLHTRELGFDQSVSPIASILLSAAQGASTHLAKQKKPISVD
jgi:TetR/AcrR family transcriptional repressor of nem operon